jgi:predicted DNA-binding protein (UPF0251 family)
MATFNPDFWEVSVEANVLENTPSDRALWYETEVDRDRRHALEEFFQSVMPAVREIMDAQLTPRQLEILRLYYFQNKTQEEIAEELSLTQSTVSRHLFGTTRNGRKVGGAIPKLRKIIEKSQEQRIAGALNTLQGRFNRAA